MRNKIVTKYIKLRNKHYGEKITSRKFCATIKKCSSKHVLNDCFIDTRYFAEKMGITAEELETAITNY